MQGHANGYIQNEERSPGGNLELSGGQLRRVCLFECLTIAECRRGPKGQWCSDVLSTGYQDKVLHHLANDTRTVENIFWDLDAKVVVVWGTERSTYAPINNKQNSRLWHCGKPLRRQAYLEM